MRRIAKVAFLVLLFSSHSFAAEGRTVKELEFELIAVRAQGAAASADFERGRAMVQAGPVVMRDAQRRLEELVAQEQALIKKIEALKAVKDSK